MTYKFNIEEIDKVDTLRLYVYTMGDYGFLCSDIFEGPSRFIINKLAEYYSDNLRLRKVK